jgi:hypothetical protein
MHTSLYFEATHLTVILRSRAFARRLEGSPLARAAHPSRLAVKNGEHLQDDGGVVWPKLMVDVGMP